jgi:hypothetical protein
MFDRVDQCLRSPVQLSSPPVLNGNNVSSGSSVRKSRWILFENRIVEATAHAYHSNANPYSKHTAEQNKTNTPFVAIRSRARCSICNC